VSVGANAYTVGSDIVFRAGHGPGSPTFQRDVAHELTHVQQQKAGPVDGSEAAGGIRVSDPSDRFEQAASDRADEIVGGIVVTSSPSSRAHRTRVNPRRVTFRPRSAESTGRPYPLASERPAPRQPTAFAMSTTAYTTGFRESTVSPRNLTDS
jgi:hypothetical protein